MFPGFRHSRSLAYPEVKPYKKCAYGRPLHISECADKRTDTKKNQENLESPRKNQEQQRKITREKKL